MAQKELVARGAPGILSFSGLRPNPHFSFPYHLIGGVKKVIVFTIGHSTRLLEQFTALLKAHEIQMVADVRTIPKSLYNPQFNGDELKLALRRLKIGYRHLPKLGGLRRPRKDSLNLGWRNASFRGYADYMSTTTFAAGLNSLMKIALAKRTVIMCAEALPWRCHRSLIADALVKQGFLVRDIMSKSRAPRHKLTSFLKMRGGKIVYPK